MKRLVSIVLTLALAAGLFTACGGNSGSGGQPGGNEPAPTAQPTPEPTPEPYEANVLTGYEKNLDYPEGQRITAVMVNNLTTCRPQRGLSAAQMLFEIKVEGGITRFMALFNDYNEIPTIGPVRSARDQFFRLVLPWQPLYVHIGQSVVQKQYIENYDYDEWNLEGNFDSKLYFRDKNRRNWAGNTVATEHTAYTSGELIADYISRKEVDDRRSYNSTFFNFVDYRDPAYIPTGEHLKDGADPIAERVTIRHSQSYRTRFDYDPTLGQYKMAQYYSSAGNYRDTVDENNDQQLTFDNLIVLFTDIHVYPGHEAKDLQEAIYEWGGVGYYCYGGKIELIRWQKGTDLEALRLVTFDTEEPFYINCGKSYVTVVDQDELGNFKWEPLATAQETQEAPTSETFQESDD
ncbi:DUF3048 domain-containing protein [Allofournierella sp.]|uniref:DUF3048 domain-containing protein n=1 Tax=Allofournierella sp. TaxID=1940256 RepID=UPI0015AAD9A2